MPCYPASRRMTAPSPSRRDRQAPAGEHRACERLPREIGVAAARHRFQSSACRRFVRFDYTGAESEIEEELAREHPEVTNRSSTRKSDERRAFPGCWRSILSIQTYDVEGVHAHRNFGASVELQPASDRGAVPSSALSCRHGCTECRFSLGVHGRPPFRHRKLIEWDLLLAHEARLQGTAYE